MTCKRYTIAFILRISLLILNALLLSVLIVIFYDKKLIFLPAISLVILIFQIIDFLLSVSRTNRELNIFLLALGSSDFSVKFKNEKLGSGFDEVRETMNRIIESFEQDGIQKEVQVNYLNAILRNINIGIITINKTDKIELINDQAMNILGIPRIKYLHELRKVNPEFAEQIESMKPADHKLLEYKTDNEIRYLSVAKNTIKQKDAPYGIFTFHNIRSEIDQKEIESWHRLIRILRHEIMNSVTPISSLTETIMMLVEDETGNVKKQSDLDQKDIEDIRESIKTIQSRSDGLYDFVDKYREVSKIPDPNLSAIEIKELFSSVSLLFSAELENNNIRLETLYKKEGLAIKGDFQMIEQVLINLIKNSIHAVRTIQEPEITLISDETDEHVVIQVRDNGCGIKQHEMDEIFVPFYSTREYGTGIGLSLSKEIMWRHGGTISVKSEPGKETVFTLRF